MLAALLISTMFGLRSSTGSGGIGINPAAKVLGQVNFTNTAPNLTDPAGLFAPTGVAIDQSTTPNRIYVADQDNSRILGWSDVASFTDGAPADLVIGQTNFYASLWNQNGLTASAATLSFPTAVAVDGSGNLYVLDAGNNRVLEYDSPFTTDTIADRVIGQPDFAANQCNQGLAQPTPDTLCPPYIGNVNPGGVAIDSAGNLYVADSRNNRVLEYDNPLAPGGGTPGTPGAAGDATADVIFGTNLFEVITNPSPTTLSYPTGVAVDGSGNLYVADWGNNRVLEYFDPLAAGGGTPGISGSAGDIAADLVLGQPDFTTRDCLEVLPPPYAPNEICTPTGVTVDSGGNVYVADNYLAQRVLEFNAPLSDNQNANLIMPGFQYPVELAVDSSDNLYVAAAQAGYVEEFDQPVVTGTVTPNRTLGVGGINGVKPAGMNNPKDVAIDSSVVPNRLYVSDSANQRIMGWRDESSFANGAPADLIFTTRNMSADRLAVDPQGNLYVSGQLIDFPTHYELVEYNTPFALPPGASNLDLGITNGRGIATDAAGNVWAGNGSELLEWDNPTAPGGGTPGTPGSPGDTTPDLTIDISQYGQVRGLWDDLQGNLWVAANGPVVEFDNPLAPGGGTPGSPGSAGDTTPDLVINPDPSCTLGEASAHCFTAWDVAVDTQGTLFVDDNINNRILGYQNPLLQNPANLTPEFVFGQNGSFTTGFCNGPTGFNYFNVWRGASAATLCDPLAIAIDTAGNLLTTDLLNNRVLEYQPPFVAAPTVTPSATPTATAAPTATATPTATVTPTATAIATATATVMPTATATITATATETATATPTATPTPLPGAVLLAPKKLKFGVQLLGFQSSTLSRPRRLRLVNHLNLPVAISSITTSSPDFIESDGCGHLLAPHLSCRIKVQFSPAAVGPRIATLTIVDNAANNPQTAQLHGRGTPATLTIALKRLRFGKQTVSTASLSQRVRVQNLTPVNVSFNSLITTGGYEVTNLCSGPYVAPHSSCNLEVKFKPVQAGPNPGTLTIIDGVSNATVVVQLGGFGVSP
ncbi:MAG TPA: choice-of-anchor D domain-containing protein [Candidatus Binataceae bacterium]|nr:choice-of-anchor D domain-containing protein [Candidatus Binataceae bacterium]